MQRVAAFPTLFARGVLSAPSNRHPLVIGYSGQIGIWPTIDDSENEFIVSAQHCTTGIITNHDLLLAHVCYMNQTVTPSSAISLIR